MSSLHGQIPDGFRSQSTPKDSWFDQDPNLLRLVSRRQTQEVCAQRQSAASQNKSPRTSTTCSLVSKMKQKAMRWYGREDETTKARDAKDWNDRRYDSPIFSRSLFVNIPAGRFGRCQRGFPYVSMTCNANQYSTRFCAAQTSSCWLRRLQAPRG